MSDKPGPHEHPDKPLGDQPQPQPQPEHEPDVMPGEPGGPRPQEGEPDAGEKIKE